MLVQLQLLLIAGSSLLLLVSPFRRHFHYSSVAVTSSLSKKLSEASLDTEVESSEDIESFKNIAKKYLSAKFQDCSSSGDNCILSRQLDEVVLIPKCDNSPS